MTKDLSKRVMKMLFESERTDHPCFNSEARRRYGRIHLPIAVKCNIQCRFCNRKYDCVNEGRPGVTSAVLSPRQALRYLRTVVDQDPDILVVGLAGPGDPLADPEETLETLRLIRAEFPRLLSCLATNGLNLPPYLDALAQVGLSHATITVNAVDPEIGAQIYAWVRDGKVVRRGREAAELLIQRQAEAVRGLKARNIAVKINAIVIPGYNADHIPAVAQAMAALGADIFNCIPLLPAPGSAFADVPEPSPELLRQIREKCREFLPQMEHCVRCRADAAGLLGAPLPESYIQALIEAARGPLRPEEERPCVAAASLEGILVNQHLGEAERLLIYRRREDGFEYVGSRRTPPQGSGIRRWLDLAEILKDCRAVLVSGAGDSPREALRGQGIQVIEMEGLIEDGLDAVYNGRDFRRLRKRRPLGCGGCGDGGPGCG